MLVLSEGTDGDRRSWILSTLLPDAFGAANLGA
jgi:hypothetical protein